MDWKLVGSSLPSHTMPAMRANKWHPDLWGIWRERVGGKEFTKRGGVEVDLFFHLVVVVGSL